MQAFRREFINIWEPYNWGFLIQCQFMMLIFKLGEKLGSSDIDEILTLKARIVNELKETFECCDNNPPRLSYNPFSEDDDYRRVSYDFDVCIAKAMQVIFNPENRQLKSLIITDLDTVIFPENPTISTLQ